jgi:hypothetical protein
MQHTTIQRQAQTIHIETTHKQAQYKSKLKSKHIAKASESAF